VSAMFQPADRSVTLDWRGLQAYLVRHGLALDLASEPRQFAGGLGNLNYRLQVNGEPCVLRRPPVGTIPRGANDMAREHRILKDLWQAFPYAPRALHYCADAQVIGAHFLLMEYRAGLVIRGRLPVVPTLDVVERAQLSRRLVDVLVQLHQVDPAVVGLDTLGKPEGMLQRTVEGWQQRALEADEGASDRQVERLSAWLGSRIPTPQRATLLHSDYKLDNVIWDPASLAPVAVIDWDMGTRGDPLLDLATLLSYWTQPDDPPVMYQLGQMPTHEAGFLDRAQVMQRYASQTGLDLSDFGFYRVLAGFKLAIVFRQLHAKYRRGDVADERYRAFGDLSAGLLAFAADMAFGTPQ
jgi:aminoglycoside phosphotransferase (APT) family kinase protein